MDRPPRFHPITPLDDDCLDELVKAQPAAAEWGYLVYLYDQLLQRAMLLACAGGSSGQEIDSMFYLKCRHQPECCRYCRFAPR